MTATAQDPKYAKAWRLDHARGVKRLVDVEPVARHVEHLMATGFTIRGSAEVAGLSPAAVSRIHLRRQPRVNRATARALLAVRPSTILARANPAGFVPAIGARRRLRALLAIGWRHTDLSARCGFVTALALNHAGDMVERWKHDATLRVYDELWNTPGPSRRTAGRAAAAGYPPPMAWDDDTIDDPAAAPNLGEATTRADLSAITVAEVEHIAGTGTTLAGASARMGLSQDGLEQRLRRAGRADLVARLQGRAS